jgi:AcrR family transcriptional regulator
MIYTPAMKDPTHTDTSEKHEHKSGHSEDTRRAIILAAIRLIAEHGIHGASLRAINVAAGSRNSSAAHYHFGSKHSMVEAALAAIYGEVSGPQDRLFAALEERVAQGRPVGVREVLEAAYLPYLALLSTEDYGLPAAKFVSRVLVESDTEIQAVLNGLVAPAMHRGLALLRYALPHVPEDVLKRRLFITVTNVVHGAGDVQAVQNSPFGDLSGDSPLDMLHVLFEYLNAAVSAPSGAMTPADMTRMGATLFPS